jgi:hypothetical protein
MTHSKRRRQSRKAAWTVAGFHIKHVTIRRWYQARVGK